MKKVFAFTTLLTLAFLGSCSLFSTDEPDFGDQVYYDDIYGKWNFTATSNTCSYIEFTEAGYFFTGNQSGVVSYGRYNKTDDLQITLTGLGVMDISDFGDSYLYFDITFDGNEDSESVRSGKATEMDIDDDNEIHSNICAVWIVTEIYRDDMHCGCSNANCECYIDGSNWQNCTCADCNCLCKEDRFEPKYIFFSEYGEETSGTISVINSDWTTSYTTWSWNEGDATTLEYYTSIFDDNEYSITISENESDSSKMIFTYTNGEDKIYYVELECKSEGNLE